jgi:LEA14-like dessication related protein
MRKCLFFFGVLLLVVTCKSPPPPAEDTPQRIVEPELTITSITILQADLVNTRLKLGLKIDNPNTVPLTFSTFRYELYGDGIFWANGMEKNLAVIPAESSVETNIGLEMNFINMKRQLLDDIIAMREVSYRIVGSVDLDAPEIPSFRIDFDFSGNSSVKH